jgi:RNA polymerase sigma-70 factor (ECF subfamily)
MASRPRCTAPDQAASYSFDEVIVPHLAAARGLARWLMRNPYDADDVVQEASLRALRYFRTFTGGDGRAWLLRIVRNVCLESHGRRHVALTDSFDERQHSDGLSHDPETLAMRNDRARLLARAMQTLPDRFRELLVRRELEGLTYQELADVMDIPLGTVMSGLSRGRAALRKALDKVLKETSPGEGGGGVCMSQRSRHVPVYEESARHGEGSSGVVVRGPWRHHGDQGA